MNDSMAPNYDPALDVAVIGIQDGARRFYLANGSSLLTSIDEGSTWTDSSTCSVAPLAASCVTTATISGDAYVLLVGTPGRIIRSVDSGHSWSAVPLPAPAPTLTVLCAEEDASGGILAIAGTLEDGVYRSVDSGISWESANVGLLDMAVFSIAMAVDVRDDGVVLIGTLSGVFRSWNRGRSWHPLELPDCTSPILSIAISTCAAGDCLVIAGTESGDLYRSCNFGDSWSHVYVGANLGEVVKILFLEGDDPGRIPVAIFNLGILVGHDAGFTWQECKGAMVPTNSASIVAAVGNDCVVAGGSVLLACSDGTTGVAVLS